MYRAAVLPCLILVEKHVKGGFCNLEPRVFLLAVEDCIVVGCVFFDIHAVGVILEHKVSSAYVAYCVEILASKNRSARISSSKIWKDF